MLNKGELISSSPKTSTITKQTVRLYDALDFDKQSKPDQHTLEQTMLFSQSHTGMHQYECTTVEQLSDFGE